MLLRLWLRVLITLRRTRKKPFSKRFFSSLKTQRGGFEPPRCSYRVAIVDCSMLGNLCGRLVMHPMKSVLNQFGRVFEVQLRLDVLAVCFHGADAQMQFAGDLAGAVA